MTLTPEPAAPLGDLVAAHFQRLEIAMLSPILISTLAGALPPSMMQVERRRSLVQRLFRRPGTIIGVSVRSGYTMLTFRNPELGRTEASVSHVVGGVVLSTTPTPVAEWIERLAELLNHATNDDLATRAALERALLPPNPPQ